MNSAEYIKGSEQVITTAIYLFAINKVIIRGPLKIIKETNLSYFTKYGRCIKSEMNKAILRNATSYPYIEIHTRDVDEATLINELSKWFANKALEMKTTIQKTYNCY